MNIYCSSDGTIFHVDTERIYQGSAGVNKVRFIGQFPSNAQVLVSYKLPNGVLKGPKILTPIATLEEVKAANGGIFSVWETVIGATPRLGTDKKPLTEIDDNGNVKTVYDLDYTITENYGVVEMQFFVYPAGETLTIDQQIYNVYGGCLATASTTFTVEKGVPMQAPRIEEFTTTDGEQLLSEILNIVSSGIVFPEGIKSSATPFLLSKLDKDGEQRAGVVLGEEYEENEQKKYKAAVESETVSIQAYEVKENGEKETKAQVSVNDKGEVNFYGDNFFVNGEEINFKDGETALSKAKDNELLIKGLGDKYVALQSPPAYARSYYYRTIRENGQVKNDILQGSPMNFARSLVERDVNGRAKVNDPEDEDDIVNKRTMKREIAPIEEKLKQVKFAFSFNSYDDVVTKFNAYNKDDDTFHIGQDVFVRTQNVPDLWISGISDTKNTYNYTNDAAFVEEITNNGIIQIGYVVFSALESKTILGDYASVEDLAAIMETVKNLENAVDDLLYVPISISYFSATVVKTDSGDTTPYKGDRVTEVYLSWSTNKTPESLTLDGVTLTNTNTSEAVDTKYYTSTKTWVLTASDGRNAVDGEARITFYDAVYYGIASAETYDADEDFIKALSKKVASNSKPSISGITGKTGEYLFYCIPSSRGECSFTDNDTGFPFAMEKVATDVGYSNGNYTTTYDVYKSINSISGSISVTVK